MAEVIGFASAGVGIASFAVQILGSLSALRDAYQYNRNEAPQELQHLTSRLEFLKQLLEHLQPFEGNPIIDHPIAICQSTYNGMEKDLIVLLDRMHGRSATRKTDLKSVKLCLSGRTRKRIEEIGNKIDSMTIMMNASLHLVSKSPLQSLTQDSTNSPKAPGICSSNADNSTDDECVISSETTAALPRSFSTPVTRRVSCTVRHCHCSCHMTENISGRFYGLEYTPLSAMFGKCDNNKCDMKGIRWKWRFAFSKFSIPWALLVDFQFILRNGSYSLRPALSLQRVVNFTSPGFTALWRCKNHLISLPEARDELRRLYRLSGPLRQDINPAGDNYIQELLCHGPWSNQANQFALLDLLVHELGMGLENEDNRLLIRCASWIGEGRHLDLLELILRFGFDPSGIDSPLFQKWPLPCSPGWILEEATPDPFFIEYLTTLSKDNPGFGGSTPLQDAVLCGSAALVRSLLQQVTNLENHRNFLGQTPLHLAVLNPELFKMILEAGFNMDSVDGWGITPLMYASAMGMSEIVQLLILRGAKIMTRDKHLNRGFMNYTYARGHWDLVLESLNAIRQCYGEEVFQYYVYDAIINWASSCFWLDDSREKYFESLLELCEDSNITFGDGHQGTACNNLLHYVKTESELRALIRHGFQGFNEPNSDGKLPVFSIMRHGSNVDLLRCCLDNGTDINHIDHSSHTIIFSLLPCLNYLKFSTWDTVSSIKLCLDRGMDVFHADNCRCACSPKGCHTPSGFLLDSTSPFSLHQAGFIWAFEWLSMIEEFCGREAAKDMLLAFIRRTRFDMLGITHVCCHKGRGLFSQLRFFMEPNTEDAEEILDEEQEAINTLEEEMQGYTSESFETLRSQWMGLLKQMNTRAIINAKAKQEKFEHKYVVDHENDTFYLQVICGGNFWYNIPHKISEYAFWLQHEYLRGLGNKDTTLFKEGWYERRTSWLAELIDVMGASLQKIEQSMEWDYVKETRLENIDTKSVIDQFWCSMMENSPSERF